MSHKSLQTQGRDWRTRAMLMGGVIGSLIGVSAAYLYVRATEEASEGGGEPRRLGARDMVGIGMGLFAIIRQIAELGARRRD